MNLGFDFKLFIGFVEFVNGFLKRYFKVVYFFAKMIREMALQQKQMKEAERSRSMGRCHLSWNCKTAASTTGGI